MIKLYCHVCSKQFTAQRSSGKYCSEACKQQAKYSRQNDFTINNLTEKMNSLSYELDKLYKTYFDDQHNPDDLINQSFVITQFQHTLSKMEAKIMTIEIDLDNRWYECLNCGQKTFGRVKSCDFCAHERFKLIKPV